MSFRSVVVDSVLDCGVEQEMTCSIPEFALLLSSDDYRVSYCADKNELVAMLPNEVRR